MIITLPAAQSCKAVSNPVTNLRGEVGRAGRRNWGSRGLDVELRLVTSRQNLPLARETANAAGFDRRRNRVVSGRNWIVWRPLTGMVMRRDSLPP
jgi:hypothetical protein